MACQTCDHTMQLMNDRNPSTFWCPRCGTLKCEGMVPEFVMPGLVGRSHAVCSTFDTSDKAEEWDVATLDRRVQTVRECFMGLQEG